ncbi:hypothetical protein FIBSPDRAFT_901006 [Athelia psychrophila]|uniref:Uncharacterized protein n=1 Tax=Athelia psychrophila TaxID=1759441 RepID=A0A165XPX6_9AGAM|nr:hypothetical protein FIBSPDRAFT_901006 [Fibularhizoctonia sp. CBS 109695]
MLCSTVPSYSSAQRELPDDSDDEYRNNRALIEGRKLTEDPDIFWERYRVPVPHPQQTPSTPPQQTPSTPPRHEVDPDIFWERYREPVPPPQQTPPTAPRHEVQQMTSHLGDPTHLEIRLPAWIMDFSDISINISPRRGTAQAREVNQRPATPIITMAYHHETPVADTSTPPPPIPDRTRPRVPLRTQPSQVNAGPQPIYPLQPGEVPPRPRILRDDRTHGYYVVFIGPRLGIYHEYWSDIEPYLRRNRGGYFRKGQTLEKAKALWNDPYFTKQVID